MILKAGTYTFNMIPYLQPKIGSFIAQENFNYTAHYDNEYSSECTYMTFSFYETEEMLPDEYFPIIETDDEAPYDGGVWSFEVPLKITTTEDQEVSEEFYDIFAASTNYNAENGIASNVLGWRKLKNNYMSMYIYPTTINHYSVTSSLGFSVLEYDGFDKLTCIFGLPNLSVELVAIDGIKIDGSDGSSVKGLREFDSLVEMLTTTPFKVLSTDSSTVDRWLSENTEAVESDPTTEIFYDGLTIAKFNPTEMVTIPCSQYSMSRDIKVKAYWPIISKSITLTSNKTVDVSDVASVIINVPTIVDVIELPMYTKDTNIRSLYRYNGKLYMVAETSEGTWEIDYVCTGTMELDGLRDINVPFESNGETFSVFGLIGQAYCDIYYDGTQVYDATGSGQGTWTNENYKIVTFSNNDSALLAWLSANAKKITNVWTEYQPEQETYTISGIYIIKDEDLAYGCKYFEEGGTTFANLNFTSNGRTFHTIQVGNPNQYGGNSMQFINDDADLLVYFKDGGWDPNWDNGKEYKTIDFGSMPQVVSKEFYEFLTDITTYYIVEITENSTVDVSTFKAAIINVPDNPKPIEVNNEALMSLSLELAPVGSVLKYTGDTTDTYENGALYLLEEVSE